MGLLSRLFQPRPAPDILDLLTSQHDEIDRLLADLAARPSDRRAVVTELADTLAAHLMVEEEVFYPFVMSRATNELLQDSVEEHFEIKYALAELIATSPQNDAFLARLEVLRARFDHHAHAEEEARLFPRVGELLGHEDRAELGVVVQASFEERRRAHHHRLLPREIGEVMPVRRR